MFKIGDKVRALQLGHVFDAYEDMAEQLGLSTWAPHTNPDPSATYAVVSTASHPRQAGCLVCAIEQIDTPHTQFMVDEKGLCLAGTARQFKVNFNRIVKHSNYRIFVSDCTEHAEALFDEWAAGLNDSSCVEFQSTEEL